MKDLAALISALTPTLEAFGQIITALTALGAMLFTWHNSRKLNATNQHISDVHIAFNSRMDEMLALTKKAAMAEGVRQGTEEGLKQGREEKAGNGGKKNGRKVS